MSGSRLPCDLDEPMASVIETWSEACGRCVEEIDISAEVEYRVGLFCRGQKYVRFILVYKAAQNLP